MNSVIVYEKYRRVCTSFVRLVDLLSECVRLRLDGVICGSPFGLRRLGRRGGTKKAQLVQARLQHARWRMHEHPSHSSFIGGKGTGGQKGRQYFGYPGQDPNSPSQQIQIPRSPWNFAMCCFHGLARCPCIARNIKMHFFTNSRMHARDN